MKEKTIKNKKKDEETARDSDNPIGKTLRT